MTRLGDFRKFLATNFTKLAEIVCDVWAIFENITQLKSKKNCCGYFLNNFWKNLGYILFLVTLVLGRIFWCEGYIVK